MTPIGISREGRRGNEQKATDYKVVGRDYLQVR